MKSTSSPDQRLREILIAANSGEATTEQFDELDGLIRSDRQSAKYAALLLDQQASLAWQGAARDLARTDPEDTTVTLAHPPRAIDVSPSPSHRAGNRWVERNWSVVAVSIAFVLGAIAALVAGRLSWTGGNEIPLAMAAQQSSHPAYEARLVRSTACLWDGDSAGSRAIGSDLTSGESLHLLEGLAEFNLNWSRGGSATISLEGPAAMLLTSEGMPSLRFGRLSATISGANRPFVLETSVGRLVLGDYGSFGVSAFGNDAEIHVFDGGATLEPTWLSSLGRPAVPLRIEAGDAVRIQAGANGELVISRHAADEGYFVAQLSMTTDALLVPSSYVAAVKSASPIGYWRFERDVWPQMPNEMGDELECRLEGSLGTIAYAGNHALEFGVTDRGGEVVSNDVLDDAIGDSYSIEFWIKPSHYHVGAVVSLVGDGETPNGIIPHGVLLELGGSGLIPTAVHHPGRIRFLHRYPASNDSQTGTSCYSTEAYTLRKWQHLVAVKDGSRMRLYINGNLAGEGEDASALPSGLRLLVGRLYPSRRVRPFIGQLDELALYDRALAAEEIAAHYRIMRPAVAAKPSI